MKYFYALDIDSYPYWEVTEKRYKNEIEFIKNALPEIFSKERLAEWKEECIEEGNQDYLYDITSFCDCGYELGNYIAVDENGQALDNLEDEEITFKKIFDYGRIC